MFRAFLSDELRAHQLKQARPAPGAPDLLLVGNPEAGVEVPEALSLLSKVWTDVQMELGSVLQRRAADRSFIDQRTKACAAFNANPVTAPSRGYRDPKYQTVIGLKDTQGRVVVGPLQDRYVKTGGAQIAPLPDYLKGPHVTLFGPPDTAKLAINAVNCFHRKLPNEPPIVADLVAKATYTPKWGADDEDSKTPLRSALASAALNLKGCFDGTLTTTDEKTGKVYKIGDGPRALPIKRIPGISLPCTFLFSAGDNQPLPLHLYDFVLHCHHEWRRPEAMVFYIPKLETEEEARYVRNFIRVTEDHLRKEHPEYQVGTIRLIIVMENARAIFRAHEIMDALYPYFAGASLGWHDYLASAARVFKEDPNYRIPVKADPDIVIKYIKASHHLLADVVGPRGGIKIGGMYGVLSMDTTIDAPGFQVVLKGYFRDVCTQLKRGLNGFWVAHPDFVRIGIALVEAWREREEGRPQYLEKLVRGLLVSEAFQNEVLNFINGPDISGLDVDDPLYPRALVLADLPESAVIANNDPVEIRYNVFQTLQYFADWLSGRGCVALPAIIGGHPVRVMDDLATCERSRWEVWSELYHKRFPIQDFLRIAQEEYLFIRKDLSNGRKIVQVKFNSTTDKWYPIAFNLTVRLMTDPDPVEFATELLLTFTIPEVRAAADPWEAARKIDPVKFGQRFAAARL
jgi:malate synthase